MSEKYYIVSKFELAEANREPMLKAIKTLAEATRREAGCEFYLFTQDQTNPGLYSFLECWRDEAAFQAHLKTPHFKTFAEIAQGRRENSELLKLKQII